AGQELLDQHRVMDVRDELAARMKPAALAEGHQLLDDRTQVLRLGQGGLDLLMLHQRLRQIHEQRLAMALGPIELTPGHSVTHGSSPLSLAFRKDGKTDCTPRSPQCFRTVIARSRAGMALSQTELFNTARRDAWPALRCSQAASWGFPYRDGDPSAPALP